MVFVVVFFPRAVYADLEPAMQNGAWRDIAFYTTLLLPEEVKFVWHVIWKFLSFLVSSLRIVKANVCVCGFAID